jgi:DNA-directed RNA polymerase subunit RPC12/RpoP
MSTEQAKPRTDDMTVATSDILFDCPGCGKSLVVDEAAEGMIVDCPQCRTNVIVPPKSSKSASVPTVAREPKPDEEGESSADMSPRSRIAVLAGQLKEIQAQRTEVTGRIAARLNDVNRDLVMLARLETSQQKLLSEWNQLLEKISAAPPADGSDPSQPTVIGTSISNPTRVPFRE